MKDGQIISKESIQIEPLTRKGFPYALNDDGKNLKMLLFKIHILVKVKNQVN